MVVSDNRTIPEIVLSANFVPPHQLFPLYTSDNVEKQSYNRTAHSDE